MNSYIYIGHNCKRYQASGLFASQLMLFFFTPADGDTIHRI